MPVPSADTFLRFWLLVCCVLIWENSTIASEANVLRFLTSPPDVMFMEFCKVDHLEARTIKLPGETIEIPSVVSNSYIAGWCRQAFFLKTVRTPADTNLFNSDRGDYGFQMAGIYSNRTWCISGCQLFYWDDPAYPSERFYWLPDRPEDVQPNPPRIQALVAFRTVASILTLGVIDAIPGTWTFTGPQFLVRSVDGNWIHGNIEFGQGDIGKDVLLRYSITNGALAGQYESSVVGTQTMDAAWVPARIVVSKEEAAVKRTLCEITMPQFRLAQASPALSVFDPFSFVDKHCLEVLVMREGAIYSVVGDREVFRESLIPGVQPIQRRGSATRQRYVVISVLFGISGVFVLAILRRTARRQT